MKTSYGKALYQTGKALCFGNDCNLVQQKVQFTIFTIQLTDMITTYSDFRLKLKTYLDQVFKSNSPLFVTRTKGENVVVLSQSDYDSIMETFYLLKSPRNAERLLQAVNDFKNRKGEEHNLDEA